MNFEIEALQKEGLAVEGLFDDVTEWRTPNAQGVWETVAVAPQVVTRVRDGEAEWFTVFTPLRRCERENTYENAEVMV